MKCYADWLRFSFEQRIVVVYAYIRRSIISLVRYNEIVVVKIITIAIRMVNVVVLLLVLPFLLSFTCVCHLYLQCVIKIESNIKDPFVRA